MKLRCWLQQSARLGMFAMTVGVFCDIVPAGADERDRLSAASSWVYQLQNVTPSQIASSSADVAVIDFAQNGSILPLSSGDVTRMRVKPDGSRRLVLAYLSIGEAEDYRYYWKEEWRSFPPGWLNSENPDWPGNYSVEFWNPDWQSIIFGSPTSYLDRIQALGFDGVYLDRVDAFESQDATRGRTDRMKLMIEFVSKLAAHARAKNRNFLVVAQNAEELLAEVRYRDIIDGIGKEDLFFGVEGDGRPNGKSDVRASLSLLRPFMSEGKPVFLVEYLHERSDIAIARRDATQLGVPLFIARRELDHVASNPN